MSDEMRFDVLIIGAGPAGLSAAIRLKQLAQQAGREISVAVLEKGAAVGAHILSGCVLETRALDELLPDWRQRGAPLRTKAVSDEFLFLTKNRAWHLPTPPAMHNAGNYIISLSNFTAWLGEQAQALGVDIFTGFPAAQLWYEHNRVVGVITGDMGISHDGSHSDQYQPGLPIRCTQLLLAEGCHGQLSKQVIARYDLRAGQSPQTYGLGIKELWQIDPAQSKPGHIIHSIGWPLDHHTYGGSFLYHLDDGKVAVGFVTGLDYANPYLSPFEEFQRFKTHPKIAPLFAGGKRIAYGARALNEGGWQSLPKLSYPGGVLIGCAAGFMNVPKIKGTHTAMYSAMLAAEAVFTQLQSPDPCAEVLAYEKTLRASWVGDELYRVRNIRPGFRFGLWAGLGLAALDTYVFRGRAPWTLRHHADHAALRPAKNFTPIAYPKPDGVLTFDRLSSVYLSNTNHREDQPAHLRLTDPLRAIAVNAAEYASPETRYCPAGVYEIIGAGMEQRLQINAQNCVHCKTCDIKDPTQNIEWVAPEGGGGPNYSGL
jgi:electron-transferring-flavoprotein dehydrogenase